MYRHFTLLIATLAVLALYIGCQQMGILKSPHPPGPNMETRTASTTEVTVGGKIFKIDPKRSYQAMGVWVNPNPRALTEAEKARLTVVQAELEKLSLQTDKLSDEASYLQRIEEPKLKVRYTFGMPPHRAEGDIIDLGEFQMEMIPFTTAGRRITLTSIFKNTVKTVFWCLAIFLTPHNARQTHGEEPLEIWIGNVRERHTSRRIFNLSLLPMVLAFQFVEKVTIRECFYRKIESLRCVYISGFLLAFTSPSC